jgi:hypothetical protein
MKFLSHVFDVVSIELPNKVKTFYERPLTAMLTVQHQNNNGKPIYGCWLQCKMWNFCTLHQKSFCVSRTFDASQKPELNEIVLILMQLKEIILRDLI